GDADQDRSLADEALDRAAGLAHGRHGATGGVRIARALLVCARRPVRGVVVGAAGVLGRLLVGLTGLLRGLVVEIAGPLLRLRRGFLHGLGSGLRRLLHRVGCAARLVG